jgi:myosin-5
MQYFDSFFFFFSISGLYTKDVIQFYVDQRVQKKSNRDTPPHVFAVAERAFMALANKGPNGETANLSIVVSGESGAGKTEAAKQNLMYLAAVSMSPQTGSGGGGGGGTSSGGETKSNGTGRKLRSTRSMLAMGYSPGVATGVVDKIISANPILEAFGNAKTTRNKNSSRFGKWLQVVYDSGLSILGSKNKTFLLEKSRVVYQAMGEHSFHIFYFLLIGGNTELRQSLQLMDTKLSTWKYLQWCGDNGNAAPSEQEISSLATHYNEMKDSFAQLNFDANATKEIFEIMAGILHLGNCEYVPLAANTSGVEGSQLSEPTKKWMNSASTLLKVDSHELEMWTTKDETSVNKAGGASFTLKHLNVLDANSARDSASKAMYSKLFDWLVTRINNECLPKTAAAKQKNFIGLLDIFGFERFESNGFDQLCKISIVLVFGDSCRVLMLSFFSFFLLFLGINYCNEKLQQVFSKSTFEKELALYTDEGVIELPKIVIPDNSQVLEHVGGLFKILQDLIKAK